MPIYEFVDQRTGKPAEVFFERMEGKDGPPSIGEYIEGTRLKRVASMPRSPVIRQIRFQAHSQPPWASGASHYTKDGVPCFENKRQVERYVAHQNALVDKDGMGEQGGEYIAYDAAPGSDELQEKKRNPPRRVKPVRLPKELLD